MNNIFLKNCALFSGVPADELRHLLEAVPHHVLCYDKGELIFRCMEEASRIGIIMEGSVQSVKPFPNGNQVSIAVRKPGDMIGPAAVFSMEGHYPCDVAAAESSAIMMFEKGGILQLLQTDVRILENFTRELATAVYTLQDRVELLSYSGIAQKAAFYLLMQQKKAGKDAIRIPKSVSNLARILDVSRPSLHRELKKLEEERLISCDSHVIHILNANALQDILGK